MGGLFVQRGAGRTWWETSAIATHRRQPPRVRFAIHRVVKIPGVLTVDGDRQLAQVHPVLLVLQRLPSAAPASSTTARATPGDAVGADGDVDLRARVRDRPESRIIRPLAPSWRVGKSVISAVTIWPETALPFPWAESVSGG